MVIVILRLSDTSDDVSDHDLTPCNMSPSLSQLMTWNMGGASASSVRPGSSGLHLSHETDEFEGLWKEHVHIIVQQVNELSFLHTWRTLQGLNVIVNSNDPSPVRKIFPLRDVRHRGCRGVH